MERRYTPSRAARCRLLALAVLAAGFGPATAGAAGLGGLTSLADQVQQQVWNGNADAAGIVAQVQADVAKQAPQADLAQTIVQATQRAVRTAQSTAAAEAASSQAAAHATPTSQAARVGTRPRRQRDADAATQPRVPVSSPTRLPVASAPIHVNEEPARERREANRQTAAPPATGGPARAPRPFPLPPVPPLPGTFAPSGSASGAGQLAPVLLVALAAAIGFFVFEVMVWRVPACRLPRPRQISLAPWRPG
jgi:hypothetical protein